jgi:hypothetical protein
MSDKSESQFEAAEVRRVAATKKTGRVELRFSDANETQLTVTLPLEVAVKLGRLISDLADGTPFLEGKWPAAERKTKS